MRLLEILVRLVSRIAQAVVRQRDGLAWRLGYSIDSDAGAVFALAELVDVVADMHHRIEIGTSGDCAVDVEEAGGIVRARDQRKPHARRAARWKGPGSADRRLLPIGVERVVIRAAGHQPAHVHLDGVITRRCRFERAARHDMLRARIGGDTPAHGEWLVDRGSARRHARPDDDPIVERIATRHAVLKAAVWRCALGLCAQRPGDTRGRCCPEELTACQRHALIVCRATSC
jgi:hypothetical protein